MDKDSVFYISGMSKLSYPSKTSEKYKKPQARNRLLRLLVLSIGTANDISGALWRKGPLPITVGMQEQSLQRTVVASCPSFSSNKILRLHKCWRPVDRSSATLSIPNKVTWPTLPEPFTWVGSCPSVVVVLRRGLTLGGLELTMYTRLASNSI